MLCALKTKCMEMGVQFVTGELTEIHTVPQVTHVRGDNEMERILKKVTVSLGSSYLNIKMERILKNSR